MKNCPRCLSPIENETEFCGVCGLKIEREEQEIFSNPVPDKAETHVPLRDVVEPTKEIEALDEFDPMHTRSFDAQEIKEEAKPAKPKSHAKKRGKFPVKWVAIGAAVVVLLAGLAVLLTWVFRDKTDTYSVYAQDGRLMLLNTETGKSIPICDDITGADGKAVIGKTVMTADGKTLFYTVPQEKGVTLYQCRIKDPAKSAQKIADRVEDYIVSQNGEAVFYQDVDGMLYCTDGEKKDKLGALKTLEGESRFGGPVFLSEDGKTAVYRLANDQLYEKKQGSEPSLVAEKVTQLYTAKADISEYYYTQEGEVRGGSVALYKRAGGKSARVDTDVAQVDFIADGSFYYTKHSPQTIRLYDYVIDDIGDVTVEKPEKPKREDYDSTQEFWDAENQYYADKAAYEESQESVSIRSELQATTVTVSETQLYYYDGNKATLLSQTALKNMSFAQHKAVALYTEVNTKAVGKTELSRLSSAAQLQDALTTALKKSQKTYIAVGMKKKAIDVSMDVEETQVPKLSDDGTRLMFVTRGTDAAEQTSENGGKVQAHVWTLDENGAVTARTVGATGTEIEFDTATGVYFLKAETDGKCSLYDGDKQVANNGAQLLMTKLSTQTLYVLSDYDDAKQTGALLMYTRGKEPQKIADDVRCCNVDADGRVTYLTDYNAETGEGDLFIYDGDHRKIAEEAEDIERLITASGYAKLDVDTFLYFQF